MAWPLKKDKDLGYGICINSCECEVIKKTKIYKVDEGSLVKLFEFNLNNNVGLSLSLNGHKLHLPKSKCFDNIPPQLFRYLNAINDIKERLEFYTNVERREFVLHLKKDSVVSVGFSKGIQIKASFIGLIESEKKIFITVKLLENPSSLILKDLKDFSNNKQSAESCIYSLPANLIRTFPPPAIIDQKNHENLQNDNTPSEHLSSVLHGSVKHEHRDNYIKSNVSIYKTISVVVEPPKTKINSQNPTGSSRRENYDEPNKNKMFDTSYNKATSDEPKNDYSAVPVRQHTKYFEKHSEKSVAPALNVSLNSSADIPKNSEISVAGSNVSKSDIGMNCDGNKKNIGVRKNSKASVDSNISTDTSYNKATSDEPKNDYSAVTVRQHNKFFEKHSEKSVAPALNVSLNSSADIPKNSEISVVGSNVSKSDIGMNCDGNKKNIGVQKNSKASVDSNITTDTSYNKATSDEPKNDYSAGTVRQHNKFFEKHSEKSVAPALNVSLNSSADIPKNSEVSVAGSNVSKSDIGINCDDNKKNIGVQKNSEANVDSNISTDTSLTIKTPINLLETNEDDLSDNSNIAVIHNISASNCIICKKNFDISEGFFFDLCKHSLCKICINNQTALKKIAYTNIMPCCDRPMELDEKKYFSDIQQCFDKNCCAYHLWEECGEDKPIAFKCNKCELENCLKCGTIHVNLTCGQYDKIKGEGNSVDNETLEMFLTMIRQGVAMPCPSCEALIEKDEGCDWVQCSICNTEICWATRGPRWGPDGKDDTSGGCRCDFKVKKCVENCNYCH